MNVENVSFAIRRTLLGAAGVALVSVCGAPVHAQNAAETAKPIEPEEIVVSASRLDRAGFLAPTPTTVLGAEDIQRAGVTNIGQLAYQLPQFQPQNNPSTAATRSAGGGSNFNLRGLGNNRTLFLVDSRRHVPNSPDGTVDSNIIPSAIVERLEVVTGGASAAWGSDAIAGVVNVILKKEFEGLQVDVQAGSSGRGDNDEYKLSAIAGTHFSDGRGNFLIAGEFAEADGILNQSQRRWARDEWWVINNPNFALGNGQFARLIAPQGRAGNATEGGVIVSGVLAGTRFDRGGVPVTYNPGAFPVGSAGTIGGDGASPGQYATLVVPLKRSNVYSRLSFDFTDDLTGYLETSASSAASAYDIAQPFNFGNITIDSGNAFLPESLRTELTTAGQPNFKMGRVSTDMGFIQTSARNYNRRAVAGLDGHFTDGWTWQAYYQYGHNRMERREYSNVITANFTRAIDAVLNGAGQIVCNSTLTDPQNGCVPLNLFGEGSPSAGAIDYVTDTEAADTTLRQQVAELSTQASPFATWAGDVAIAAGGSYRKEDLDIAADPISNANGFLLGNPKSITGSINVKEAFAEVVIPLLKDVPLAKSLDLNLADRWIDYSISGSANTWKVGLTYEVNDDLRFRFTRSRDIRAPNAQELFAPTGLQFSTVRDNATDGSAVTVAVPTGTNLTLTAETANTVTAGVVYQPSWLPRLRASVDYYDIKLEDGVTLLNAQNIIDRCAAGNAALCQFLERDADGILQTVTATRVNLAETTVSGVDVEMLYSLPLSAIAGGWNGDLTLRLLASYLDEFIIDDGITAIDRAGQVAGDGVPHWRVNANLIYQNGPLMLGLSGRYVGGGTYDNTFGPFDININRFPSRTYANASFQYVFKDDGQTSVEVYGNVNNLFDRDPPIVPQTFFIPLATNPIHYDTIGRTFSVGVRVKY